MIYDKIIAQSRNPMFYIQMGVPDDLIGRYNMIVIHLAILFASTKRLGESEAAKLRQEVFEKFVDEMVSMVRDFGIDGEHLQNEAGNIAGASSKQILVYEYAAANLSKTGLSLEILKEFRKDYESTGVDADALADYMLNSIAKIEAMPAGAILGGQIEFAA
jgi:cytochrome b pre-mRNA-processing protein 3